MTGELCAVVLAAGYGIRLRPLTDLRPKPLCPVGNRPLLDRMLELLHPLGLTRPGRLAVNACWLSDQLTGHLRAVAPGAYVSVEHPPPLGTAAGLAELRDWVAGRPVLVANADAYLAGADLRRLVEGWDGRSVRLLGQPAMPGADAFDGYQFAGCSLLPWRWVRDLPTTAGELVHRVWRPAEAAGALEVVAYPGFYRDIGTVASYLAANLHAAGDHNLVAAGATVTGRCRASVVGAGARVHGELTRSVVWPGGYVGPRERLVDSVRAGADLTVTAAGADPRASAG